MKANQLSQTAAFVAIKFFGLSRFDEFRSIFDDSDIVFYDRLITFLPSPLCYYHYWLQFSLVRKLYIISEELLLPGDLLHVVARKYYIQQIADNLIDDGYEQLVVLGAGFDHLAYRFTQRNINSVELDTPYMASLKKNFFKKHYPADPHPNILNLHLPSNRLENQLKKQPAIDLTKKTLIISEGFFDYLKTETVSQILTTINQCFTKKTALITTHFALDELSTVRRWIFKNSVSLVGEDLQFDTSIAEFRDLITANEFTIDTELNKQEMRQNMQQKTGTDLPLLDGFYILLANTNPNLQARKYSI